MRRPRAASPSTIHDSLASPLSSQKGDLGVRLIDAAHTWVERVAQAVSQKVERKHN